MGHIFLENSEHEVIRERKKRSGTIALAARDIVMYGGKFEKMCDAVKSIAQETNKTPESIVEEIFYNALEYKKFLDKNLPVQVNEKELQHA